MSGPAYRLLGGRIQCQDVTGGRWEPLTPAEANELLEKISAVRDRSTAQEHFTRYFVRNYPGPDTIIHDPLWHAPRIFRAALDALGGIHD